MKKFIIEYGDFINEGARLVPPNYNTVELSWLNDPKLPLEVLKTNGSFDVTGFRKIGNTKAGSFQVYYGLSIDPKRNKELGAEDPIFKITLDELKNANILNIKKDLPAFINPTAKEILNKKRKIDYVVSLGSTAGLSNTLGQEFSKKFGANHIQLAKIDFDNFGKALNWDYIIDYDRKVREEGKAEILKSVKQDVIDAIDDTQTSPEVIRKIRKAESGEELKALLLRSNPNYRYGEMEDPLEIFWKSTPFNIRSSGISRGGSRAWLKTKYETPKSSGEFGDPELVDAIRRCVIGGATMMLVDDNSRTKEDISKIFDSIIRLAENLILDTELPTEMMKAYHKRFLAYVLIYLPVPGTAGDPNGIEVKKLASARDVIDFKNGGLLSIKQWIENNNKNK